MNVGLEEAIDRHFARLMGRFGGGVVLEALAAKLSEAMRSGHLCLNLPGVTEFPEAEQRAALEAAQAVGGPEATDRPLVWDAPGRRLYLRRYFEDEQFLAKILCERVQPGGCAGEGQEAAIAAALAGRLILITGGPGTGKTTTAVQILAGVLRGNPEARLALAAPTGKAAARLEEAIRQGLQGPEHAAVLERLPRARTVNALIGSRPGRAQARYHGGNPLAIDLLLLDEASMVALPLMAKLFAALPEGARVVLLGDRDQLASVEPGSVLADVVEGLPGAVVRLRKNYRFGNESAIYRLGEAIREGDAAAAMTAVEMGGEEVSWRELPAVGGLEEALREPVLAEYGEVVRERDPAKALERLGRFRILCALRRGPYGVEGINRMVEQILREAGAVRGGEVFAGMPLMVTRNDEALGVRNGDIGMVLPDDEGHLKVWFPAEEQGTVRAVALARLPGTEPAFAMTVHKSQGSEFDRVLLMLPDRDVPLMTRELVYTGVTRARRAVMLWGRREGVVLALGRQVERHSGLRDALMHP